MKEIEIKVLGIKKASVVKKLKSLGAKKTFSGLTVCRHFDFPDKRLRKAGKLLRVRNMGKKMVEFTYKGPKEKKGTCLSGRQACKIRQEIQTYVEDSEVVRGILEGAGMKETLYCEKKRTSYRLGRVAVDIDEYPGGIVYLEIEGPSEKLVHGAIKKLDLSDYETSCETAMRLFKRWGVEINGMRF